MLIEEILDRIISTWINFVLSLLIEEREKKRRDYEMKDKSAYFLFK